MLFQHDPLLACAAIVVAATLWLQITTRYVIEADRLVIRRGGFTWMEIPFGDIEEFEHRIIVASRFRQIRMGQLALRKMLRITKKSGFFRYVLINPRDPAPIIEACRAFKAQNFPDLSGYPDPRSKVPDWLRER